MSSQSIIHQTKLNDWISKFADQKASGLSVTEWCLRNNLSRYKFFYWKRQLKDELVTQSLPDIVPLSLSTTQLPTVSDFATTSSLDSATRASCATFATGSCARIYINGITIELESSASEHFIQTLIKAVRHA